MLIRRCANWLRMGIQPEVDSKSTMSVFLFMNAIYDVFPVVRFTPVGPTGFKTRTKIFF